MPDSRHAPSPREDHRPEERRRRPLAVIVLAVILGLEAALVAGLAVWVGVELLTQRPDSYASAVAILVIAVLAAVWVVATLVAVLALRSWARASTVTIQILQLAIAVGCFQGLYARPDVGWALLVPAVVAGALALSPPVVRATSRNTEQHE
ncbi:hypothetical protein [Leifsonia sp. AG29]|uniref:hypothetical protein n=1 Tax=Leifsonia sp. AG29 TaxID=2598860 RepID=UPI00131D4E3D|nr:hypothetical protein [Leifsonia sp. AG29]